MKKIFLFISFLFLIILGFGCSPQYTISESTGKTSVSISVDEEYKVSFSYTENATLEWKTSDDSIVSITKDTIKGLKKGNCTVTFYLKEDESVKFEIEVEVKEKILPTYEIKYDLNGGTCDNLITSFIENEVVALNTPTKAGYVFLGWFEGETKISTITNRDYDLKASWRKELIIKESNVTLEIDKVYTFDIDDEIIITTESDKVSVDSAKKQIIAVKEGTCVITVCLKDDQESKKDITVTVVAKPIVTYTINYDLNGGKGDNLVTSFKENESVELATPTKDGYTFLGWFEDNVKVETLSNKDYNLQAKWQKVLTYDVNEIKINVGENFVIEIGDEVNISPSNENISINGKIITGISEGTCVITITLKEDESVSLTVDVIISPKPIPTYIINYNLDGGLCENLVTSFKENEKVELKTPTKDGFTFLGWYEGETKVEDITNKNYELTAKWQDNKPYQIDIEKDNEANSFYLDDTLTLKAIVLPLEANQEVVWRSMNSTRASITEDGVITFTRAGEATFRAVSKEDSTVKSQITLNIIGYANPYRFIESIQVKEIVAQKIQAYSTDAGYKTYLLGGVTSYLFQDIKVTQNIIKEGNGNRPGTSSNGNPFSAKYVTVHDVGATGNALSNTNYCVASTTSVSWHFTVGNDGIFQQLPLNEVGYHAGDGTGDPLVFYNSGIKAPDGDDTPAVITVNPLTGYFMIGGKDTLVKAPTANGVIVKDSQLPYTGINNYVNEDGYYMIGKTYWNNDYRILSNRGGNLNSIGIETTVNTGSNIYLTWHYTAKLIAQSILPKTGLLPRDVKQHNTFSGKNCPQTMRRAGRWESFMEMVEAENTVQRKFNPFSWKLEFITDSPYLNSNGMIKELPDVETEVSYSIHMTNNSDFDHTFDFTVKLPPKSTIVY